MSGDRPATDLGAEREIDLRSWLDALRSRWWIAVAGLVAGAFVGGVYSLSGGSTYNAIAFIAPGQAFNPSGSSPVLTYLTNQTAINTLSTSAGALQYAAAKAGVPLGKLRGHVSTSAVNQTTNSSTSSNRNAVLVSIEVQLDKKKKAIDAANAIATYVKNETTSPYVRQSIKIYSTLIANLTERQTTSQARVNALTQAAKQPGLTLDQQLLIAIQLDQAQATLGQTINSLETTKQQQILAQQVEQTQIIQEAAAQKTTARSRRNSVVVGAVIGLLIGAIAAIVVGLRAMRPGV
jgi:capsular polysaccharide biosynthesis protein